MDEDLMLKGLKQLMFEHDWLDTGIVGITDEDIDTNDDEEIKDDTNY